MPSPSAVNLYRLAVSYTEVLNGRRHRSQHEELFAAPGDLDALEGVRRYSRWWEGERRNTAGLGELAAVVLHRVMVYPVSASGFVDRQEHFLLDWARSVHAVDLADAIALALEPRQLPEREPTNVIPFPSLRFCP